MTLSPDGDDDEQPEVKTLLPSPPLTKPPKAKSKETNRCCDLAPHDSYPGTAHYLQPISRPPTSSGTWTVLPFLIIPIKSMITLSVLLSVRNAFSYSITGTAPSIHGDPFSDLYWEVMVRFFRRELHKKGLLVLVVCFLNKHLSSLLQTICLVSSLHAIEATVVGNGAGFSRPHQYIDHKVLDYLSIQERKEDRFLLQSYGISIVFG